MKETLLGAMNYSVKCPSCFLEIKVPENELNNKIKCPRCGEKFSVPKEIQDEVAQKAKEQKPKTFEFRPPMEKHEKDIKPHHSTTDPRKVKVKADTPQGCVLCLLGVLIWATGFLNIFFVILGISLIIWGVVASKKNVCSVCGNKVESTSKICPVCNARFKD
ncbi:hypothetical protein P0Y35_14145 [Kiritimatiellaeota bacterium B1221]|nr:hypothetical protein [Kiritimatiellaeota bacterium B1221]